MAVKTHKASALWLTEKISFPPLVKSRFYDQPKESSRCYATEFIKKMGSKNSGCCCQVVVSPELTVFRNEANNEILLEVH